MKIGVDYRISRKKTDSKYSLKSNNMWTQLEENFKCVAMDHFRS